MLTIVSSYYMTNVWKTNFRTRVEELERLKSQHVTRLITPAQRQALLQQQQQLQQQQKESQGGGGTAASGH